MYNINCVIFADPNMVWYGNILFDIVHNIIESILTKHNET